MTSMHQMLSLSLPIGEIEKVAGAGVLPASTADMNSIGKVSMYNPSWSIPFVTDKRTPYYLLDNMAVLDTPLSITYQDTEYLFNQSEQLFLTPRMESAEAHLWLMNNLFKGRGSRGRVDARLKRLYKIKKSHTERADWKSIQIEWMKAVLSIKYRQCAPFQALLKSTGDKYLIEDATHTNYPSNCFWGAKKATLLDEEYYLGVNVLGKILMQLRDNDGHIEYTLPEDLHLFGIPFRQYTY